MSTLKRKSNDTLQRLKDAYGLKSCVSEKKLLRVVTLLLFSSDASTRKRRCSRLMRSFRKFVRKACKSLQAGCAATLRRKLRASSSFRRIWKKLKRRFKSLKCKQSPNSTLLISLSADGRRQSRCRSAARAMLAWAQKDTQRLCRRGFCARGTFSIRGWRKKWKRVQRYCKRRRQVGLSSGKAARVSTTPNGRSSSITPDSYVMVPIWVIVVSIVGALFTLFGLAVVSWYAIKAWKGNGNGQTPSDQKSDTSKASDSTVPLLAKNEKAGTD